MPTFPPSVTRNSFANDTSDNIPFTQSSLLAEPDQEPFGLANSFASAPSPYGLPNLNGDKVEPSSVPLAVLVFLALTSITLLSTGLGVLIAHVRVSIYFSINLMYMSSIFILLRMPCCPLCFMKGTCCCSPRKQPSSQVA